MEEAEAEAEVYYEDYDTRAEVINQCHSALTAIEYVDPYDKKGQEQKNRIKRKALDVLDYYISEIRRNI
jgi:hypothetical protein